MVQSKTMSKIKKLAGETAIYGFGSIVPRLLNFLLFPLHTRVFDPSAYGVISYLYVFVGFLSIVYTFGMETAYFRFATKQDANPQRVFNITQTGVLIISFCLSALFIIFAKPLSYALSIPGKVSYIYLLSAILFIDASVAIPFARLRLEKKPMQFAFAKIINVVILVGLNIYFFLVAFWITNKKITWNFSQISIYIHHSHYGIEYVFIANLAANLFYWLFFLKMLSQWRPAADKNLLPAMLNYAYPIMFTGLAGMINEMFSRWTLEWWLPDNFYPGKSSMYALGVFSACYKYAVFMSLTVQAFRFAAEPFFFSNALEKNSAQLFAKVNHFFVIVCSFVLLAVSINIDVLKYLLGGQAYYEGLNVVPILLLGYLFLGVYYNFSVWFKLTDRTYYGTIITVMGAILTVLLNFILIPISGYTGSSWASLICYFFMAAACYLLGQKYYSIPYKNWQSAGYILLACAMVGLAQFVQLNNTFLAIAFHVFLMLGFLGIAYFAEKKKLFRITAKID
ncbi:MAG: polysaccharide biosynthesis C-terminal domain-containing protein [Proteobacteria bacterium]|nr:polysaccharide biosynthesis C-terminal domain-containing protein [Pseudomonadota bacterium]